MQNLRITVELAAPTTLPKSGGQVENLEILLQCQVVLLHILPVGLPLHFLHACWYQLTFFVVDLFGGPGGSTGVNLAGLIGGTYGCRLCSGRGQTLTIVR